MCAGPACYAGTPHAIRAARHPARLEMGITARVLKRPPRPSQALMNGGGHACRQNPDTRKLKRELIWLRRRWHPNVQVSAQVGERAGEQVAVPQLGQPPGRNGSAARGTALSRAALLPGGMPVYCNGPVPALC